MEDLNKQKKLSEFGIQNYQRDGIWNEIDPVITGLSSDTKNVRPGYIFFAITGSKTHGANFAMSAIEKGAVIIITDSEGVQILQNEGIKIAIMIVSSVRQKLAEFAAQWNEIQPKTQIAITGTNGKTSVCNYVEQIWKFFGCRAASIGTLGVQGNSCMELKHTTPEPILLHKILRNLAENQVEYVSMEASSHGLKQCRLDGVDLKAAAFTNFSRDHLDYHADEDEYLASKCILFDRILPEGQIVVINMDDPYAQVVKLVSENRGHLVVTVGSNKEADFKICDHRYDLDGQIVKFSYLGLPQVMQLPLIGNFQAINVLIAAALVINLGAPYREVFKFLPKLKSVPGRMELVGTKKSHGKVYVDYAHTPDALLNALKSLRLHTIGKLILVFGAGGERDLGKRPLMGKIAREYADQIFITDDNPRNESPQNIRKEILKECPSAVEIPDRAEAILISIEKMQDGDVLLIAGKGHETGQIIGDDILPFNDREFVSMSLAALEGKEV